MPGPANEAGNTKSTLPVRVFFAAKWRRSRIGPGVLVRTVVSGVEDDCVIGYAQAIDDLQQLADVTVVFEHSVSIFGPGIDSRFVAHGLAYVGAKMHARRVHPTEERFVRILLTLDEIDGGGGCLVVDRLHPLFR